MKVRLSATISNNLCRNTRNALVKGIIVGIITAIIYLFVVVITTPSLSPSTAIGAAVKVNGTSRSKALRSILTRLKNHGINDPNIDVFLAVTTGDKELLQKAIDAGADLSITDTRLINSYRSLLVEIAPTELAIFE